MPRGHVSHGRHPEPCTGAVISHYSNYLRFHPTELMNTLPRKSISSVPKRANWTPFTFVVDSLLVGATNYAIGHRDRQRLTLIDKFQYLASDAGVGTNITTIYLPVAQLCYFCILARHYSNGDLGPWFRFGP
jgi:hypothetical protein